MKLSTYDRIGGRPAINAVVEALYSRIQSDPQIASYFEGVDMVCMKRRLQLFIAGILGGPAPAEMPNLTVVHSRSVYVRGLSDQHYDRFVRHFRDAVEDLNVSALLSSEVVAAIERLREDVLGQQQKKAV